MKLAVLMATYNGEKYLKEQIESIISQKTDFEFDLIIRDDGSNDKTCEILKKYANEGKIIFVEGKNIGAAKGFISMLKEKDEYDFYAFSDQDDVWYKDKLQRGVNAIRNIKGPALYCSNCELVNAELKKIGRNTHRKEPTYTLESILCLASCAQGCTSVFNKELASIVQENEIPEKYIMHDSLITCLCSLIDGTIIYDDSPSMLYRIHGENVFGMVSRKQGLFSVVKERVKEITQKKKITMYEQAKSLSQTYQRYISSNNMETCRIVIASQDHLWARIKLLFNPNLKHDTLNKTITKKLEILLGND